MKPKELVARHEEAEVSFRVSDFLFSLDILYMYMHMGTGVGPIQLEYSTIQFLQYKQYVNI